MVHDGPAALAAVAAAPPDLVLLDIGLPGMDGYAKCCAAASRGHTSLALVALTGYGRMTTSGAPAKPASTTT